MMLGLVSLALSAVAAPTVGNADDLVLVCYLRDSHIRQVNNEPSAEPFGPHKLVVAQFPSLVNGTIEGKQAKLHDPNGTFEGRSIKTIELREGAIAMLSRGNPSRSLSLLVEKPVPGDSIRKAFISTADGTKLDKMLVGHCTKDPLHNANRAFRNWQSKPATVKS